jgi:hypothetical protein
VVDEEKVQTCAAQGPFISSLNIRPEAVEAGGVTPPPPPPPTAPFSVDPLGISFEDDVTVLLHIGVSFILGSEWHAWQTWPYQQLTSCLPSGIFFAMLVLGFVMCFVHIFNNLGRSVVKSLNYSLI